MGIIDQWGNGLKLIADELKEYPQIDLRWRETGNNYGRSNLKKITQYNEQFAQCFVHVTILS